MRLGLSEAKHTTTFEGDDDFAFTIDGQTPRYWCRGQRLFPKLAAVLETQRDDCVGRGHDDGVGAHRQGGALGTVKFPSWLRIS